MDRKKCPSCKRYLPATSKNFTRDRSTRDGFRCYCKDCDKEMFQSRHDAFIEKAKREMRDPHDPRHGTNRGYSYGCRCRRCKDAHSKNIAAYRERELTA